MWVWIAQNSVVAAGAAVLVAALCRFHRTRPALCHLLWLLVFALLVAPPLPLAGGPSQSLRSAVGQWLRPAPGVAPAEAAKGSGLAAVPAPPEPAPIGADADTAAGSRAEAPRSTPDRSTGFGAVDAGAWAAAVWGAGALLLLALQVRRARAFHRRVRRAPLAGPELSASVAAVAQRLGVRAPEVRVMAGLASPSVWCLGRPRLLWPAQGGTHSAGQRGEAALIAHELAHLARRDHWVARLEVAASAICWWHPLYWFVRRRVHDYAELACDAWALWAFPSDRRAFAGALIDVQANVVRAPVALQGLCATDTEFRNFERRLQMIMNKQASKNVSRGAAVAAVLAAALAAPSFSDGGTAKPRAKSYEKSPSAEVAQVAQAGFRGIDDLVHARRLLDKGEKLFREGDYEHAIAAFRKVLELDPKSGAAHARLGYMLVGGGELDAAGEHFERQRELGHEVATATYNLACVAALAGRHEVAGEHLAHSVRLGFDNAELMARDADLTSIRERPVFGRSVELAEKAAELRKHLKELDSESLPDEALDARLELLEVVSEDGELHHEAGLLLLRAGEIEAAREAFEHQAALGWEVANAHYNIACAHALSGDTERAFEHLERSADLGLGFAGVAEDGDLASLHGDARFAALRDRISAPSRRMREVEHTLENGDPADVVAQLEALIEDPHTSMKARGWASHELGVALAALGRHSESIASQRRAVDAGYQVGRSVFHMAASYGSMGNVSEAVTHARHALALGFADPEAMSEVVATWDVTEATRTELVKAAEERARKLEKEEEYERSGHAAERYEEERKKAAKEHALAHGSERG